MVEISLLGVPRITSELGPVEVDTRKAIAVLAYLAIEGQASREVLAALFWADSPESRARATLRRTLSALRGALGPEAITADRNQVTLAPGIPIDTRQLEKEIAATSNHGHEPTDVCSSCVPHLEAATEMYQGDFLQGFSIRDAPEFEDWARSVGESLRLTMGQVLHRLGTVRAANGNYAGAIQATHRWVELDNLHEPAHRFLMLLNAWAGDRPGAIEAYRNCVSILERELGVAPLEETRELHEAILDEDLPPAPGMRRKVKPLPGPTEAQESDLIDRETERATVTGWWHRRSESGHVGVVSGGAWMGKTRLVEDLAQHAALNQGVVLTGRAYRAERAMPFGVAIQILRKASEMISEAEDRIPPWALAEFSRLSAGASQAPSDSGSDRFGEVRLYEGVFETLAAIASDRRLLIVVDDIQWIDTSSASLVGYLIRRISELPILVVLVWRDTEPAPQGLIDALQSADRLALEPLSVSDLSSRIADRVLAESIINESGGVPLLVREAIELGKVEPGATMTDYLHHRLEGVSSLGNQILTTASVVTGFCDVSLIRAVSGRSEIEVVEAVDELVAAGLLRELPNEEGLEFTLELLERTVYDRLTLARRRLLHRRAAEVLASRSRSAQDLRLASMIARQFGSAGDDRAGQWLLVAGDLARGVYANEEATAFYQQAVGLDVGDQASIRLALGELAMTKGDYATALHELTMASVEASTTIEALVHHRMGELHRLLGRFSLADEYFSKASSGHPEPSSLQADWALLHHRLGNHQAARQAASKSLELAAEDPLLRSRSYNVLAVVEPDSIEALNHLDRALELAGEHPPSMMAALNNKAHLLTKQGGLDQAFPLIEQAIEIASTTGHRHHQASLHNHLADLHHRSGNPESAQDQLTRAVSLFADIDAGSWEPELWLLSQW